MPQHLRFDSAWFFSFSNQEVEYSEEPGNLYFIKYRVAGGTRYFSLHCFYCVETFHYLIVNGHFIRQFVCHQILVSVILYSNFHFLENGFAWCTINLLYLIIWEIKQHDWSWLMLYIDEIFLQIFDLYWWRRDDFMTIATTRPETLFGDVAIAVNPEVRVLQCFALTFSNVHL